MLKGDWRLLNEDNARLRGELQQMGQRLSESQLELHQRNIKYTDELRRLVAELDELDKRHRRSLDQLEKEKEALEAKHQEQLRRKQNELDAKDMELQKVRRNLVALEGELERKQRDH